MIESPPLLAGAVQVTTEEEGAAAALTPVGAPGVVDGVAELEGLEAGPVPAGLVAVTVKV